jgi:hypothetical protein
MDFSFRWSSQGLETFHPKDRKPLNVFVMAGKAYQFIHTLKLLQNFKMGFIGANSALELLT